MTGPTKRLEAFVNALPLVVQQVLQDAVVVKQYAKGDFLLRGGEVCRASFQLTKGVARKYYLHEGKEVTTDFFFADDLAVSLQSYALQQPSEEFIQAVADTTVTSLSFEAFQGLKSKYPVLLQLDLLLTETYGLWLEQRLREFHTLSATQRYEKLLQEQPHWVQHIPLTYLASYLGISLETLSRIRARR
jgi:CRP-like cAMP-binding protein